MTTFQKICAIFVLVVAVILIAGFSSKISHKNGYKQGYADALANIKPDTEYVDKPIYIDKPVPIEVKPSGVEMYPIGTLAQMQHILDSLSAIQPDTTFIEIPVPIETKLYRDGKDSTYEAQVTGYHATLDWVKVFQRTAYINVPIPTPVYPKFMLSPAVTAMVLPKDIFVGAGVEAKLWYGRWEFSVEPGYGFNFAPDGINRGLYVLGKTKYNLIRK